MAKDNAIGFASLCAGYGVGIPVMATMAIDVASSGMSFLDAIALVVSVVVTHF
jgi:hypothetical protein